MSVFTKKIVVRWGDICQRKMVCIATVEGHCVLSLITLDLPCYCCCSSPPPDPSVLHHSFLSLIRPLSHTHTHLPRTVMRAVCPSLITKADEVTETCIPESVVDNAHRPVSIFIGHDITVCRDQSHHRHVGCEKKKKQTKKRNKGESLSLSLNSFLMR